jgi:hypothetical protein
MKFGEDDSNLINCSGCGKETEYCKEHSVDCRDCGALSENWLECPTCDGWSELSYCEKCVVKK